MDAHEVEEMDAEVLHRGFALACVRHGGVAIFLTEAEAQRHDAHVKAQLDFTFFGKVVPVFDPAEAEDLFASVDGEVFGFHLYILFW